MRESFELIEQRGLYIDKILWFFYFSINNLIFPVRIFVSAANLIGSPIRAGPLVTPLDDITEHGKLLDWDNLKLMIIFPSVEFKLICVDI